MTDMRLTLRITGDASGLRAEVIGAKREVDGLGASGREAGGQVAAGMESIAATATRALGTLAGFAGVAATVLRVARAGDEMNASLGRLAIATGSAQGAADVYERLYRLSLQTGVATSEAAGAFNRFAIAAREAGASQDQILSIVQLMQQAGALAGASTQETASATLQLGQALASGRLQGDELRSILEAMPNLAQALARELGVGVGELRKMGEEGKLTADVVIPALQRSAARMAEDFRSLPPSLARSVDVLQVASTRFLADLDRAAGLSRTIAQALGQNGVAGSLDTARRELGLGSAEETAQRDIARARSALIAARRAAGGSDGFGLGEGQIERAEAELRAAEERLAAIRQGAALLQAQQDDANAQAAAEARRRRGEQDIGALRSELDRRLRIRQEAAQQEKRVEDALTAGAIGAAQAQALRADIRRQMEQELAALNRNRALLERGAISQETWNRANARAQERYRQSGADPVAQEAARAQRVLDDLGRIGEQAFDNVGRSITQALAQGQMDFRSLRNIGMAVASELTQAFLRLAIINPIRNAIGLGGGNATTFGDLIGAVGRWWSGGGSAPAGGGLTVGGMGLHGGGIAGVQHTFAREVPLSLYSTAPRFHGGRAMIGPDEVPAILRRGEGVFTPEQMASMGPAGGSYTFAPTVYFQGDAGSDQDRRQLVAQMQAMWRQDLATLAPGIISASRAAIVGDIERRGVDAALGLPA